MQLSMAHQRLFQGRRQDYLTGGPILKIEIYLTNIQNISITFYI